MIDFTLSGRNVYKLYFVSKFKTEEYYFQASSEDEVLNFLIFECHIFGKFDNKSNKSISELFDYLNLNNQKYRKSFCFARGTYFYIKDIIKTEYTVKKNYKKIRLERGNINCIVM